MIEAYVLIQTEIAKLRAAGDPVWFADMEPTPLDPAEDGTPELRKAFAAIVAGKKLCHQ